MWYSFYFLSIFLGHCLLFTWEAGLTFNKQRQTMRYTGSWWLAFETMICGKLMIGLWSAFRPLFSYCVHTGPDLRSFAAFKYLISGKAWPSDIGGLWTLFGWVWSERSGKNLKLHLSLKATLIFLIKKSSDIIWTFLTIDLCHPL